MKGEDKFSRMGRVAFNKADKITAKPIKAKAVKGKAPRAIRKRPKY